MVKESLLVQQITPSNLCEEDNIRETIIPILLEGQRKKAFPPLLGTQVHIDFTNEERYFVELFRLVLRLYNIPFDSPGLDELMETMK